ncbi:MAG: VWA domain-containing protein, partial [Verrucomicrobiales bacterium]|nr:VWA domain-containing protein [Verrucomicrobiales bacterium]
EFYNPNPAPIEGTFLFPVPKGAQIDKFSMDIAGKSVAAELLPADKARQIYEDIVRRARDPALLEYADRDTFKARVFPIEPRSKKRLRIRYNQLLRADSGLLVYLYPLSTEKFSPKPIPDLSVKIELQTALPLKSIYSPTHEVDIRRHEPRRATVSFQARDAKPDADFALYFATEKDELGANLLTYKNGDDEGFFLLLLSPGLDADPKKILPKDVAFVLDTSGSMAGKKIEQAKKALLFCIENLNPQDRFEILRFATDVEPLFGRLADASRANRDRATEFVQHLQALGGTAINDALLRALALRPAAPPANPADQRPFLIIFLTDGRPTIGVTDENTILANLQQANPARTRVFCFGIGTDVNTHLLDKITDQTRAASQYVLPDEDLEVKLSNFFAKIKEPVLADPTLEFSGNVRVSKLYPAPLPDLFRGDQLALVGRFTGQGDATLTLQGNMRAAQRKFSWQLRFPNQNTAHDFIPRLWATRRIGHLLDQIRLHGENPELKDEVTDLARKYGIVTPYTAYLIVEDEDRRAVPLSRQTLPQLNTDAPARREAAANWRAFQTERSGDLAVAGARSGQALRFAQTPAAAAAQSSLEAGRALGLVAPPTAAPAPPPPDARERLAQVSQQNAFVAGRTFYQNAPHQWVDALLQQHTNAPRKRLQFNSSEYFAFAAKHPRALPWLALGQNVQFVLNGTVYEVYE